jgi:hypothetical protein
MAFLYKWICRRGTPGQTARTVANQVLTLREFSDEDLRELANQFRVIPKSDPNPPTPTRQSNVFHAILALRHMALPYKDPIQRGRLRSVASREDTTIADFVLEIVLAEANAYLSELGDRGKVMEQVIREELAKSGLE